MANNNNNKGKRGFTNETPDFRQIPVSIQEVKTYEATRLAAGLDIDDDKLILAVLASGCKISLVVTQDEKDATRKTVRGTLTIPRDTNKKRYGDTVIITELPITVADAFHVLLLTMSLKLEKFNEPQDSDNLVL